MEEQREAEPAVLPYQHPGTKKMLGSWRRMQDCTHTRRLIVSLSIVLAYSTSFIPLGLFQEAQAQVTTSITPSTGTGALGTIVSAPVGNVYDITGGTRAGTNLFHSFGNFSVGPGDIANFSNNTGIATSNILGRVTGGNVSNIFGTLQTTNFGSANLFLMNPFGFLFGPNATVNVGGMVAFTSADYLKLADGGMFNANPNAVPVDALTTAPVAAFGFLGSDPGAITVQGSQLTVTEGTGISLVGGNITVQSGVLDDGVTVQPAHLSAPEGQIHLASVASPGEILTSNLATAPNVNGQSFSNMGNVTLNEGSIVDVSSNAGGTVRIRGGELVIDSSTISADSVDANGAPVAIDVNVTENLSISAFDVPAFTARTTGSGNAGNIHISSGSVDVLAIPFTSIFSAIDTHTSAAGNAGNVMITTGDLTAGGFFVPFINSGTSGMNPGRGGDVTITARNIQLQDLSIVTGNFLAFLLGEGGAGTAGNLIITADSFQMSGIAQIVTDSADFVSPVGTAGNITLNVPNINLEGASISSAGQEHGGAITINTDQFFANGSLIFTQTIDGSGGSITVSGKSIELTNGSSFVSSTGGNGNGGSVTIIATDHFGILESPFGRPSGIFTISEGIFGTTGNAGDVFITTPRLEMTGGGRIDTSTATSGRGGNVTINASNSLSMAGEADGQAEEPIFNLGSLQPSGIYTRSVGSNCSGPCGNAGNIFITTGNLTTGSGAQINSGTSSSGQGGIISINATNTISVSGTLSTGQPGGIQSRSIGEDPDAGAGGNISLTAGQSVTMSDGTAVSASSTGPGATGNITINAGNQFTMTNATVTTEATQSGGGTIKIATTPSGTVQLTDSMISASVLDGTGGGGSVNIDPQYVLLQNSQILANAVFGPGGNISITTNLLLPDANSTISASSQFGQQGTVTIQSPNAPASGKILPLGKTPLIPTALLTQRCAALAGGNFSSFTMAGRDSIPAAPGGWLSSPLALATLAQGIGPEAQGEVQEANEEDARRLLSLRRIAPPGFLTQTFAIDQSPGCAS